VSAVALGCAILGVLQEYWIITETMIVMAAFISYGLYAIKDRWHPKHNKDWMIPIICAGFSLFAFATVAFWLNSFGFSVYILIIGGLLICIMAHKVKVNQDLNQQAFAIADSISHISGRPFICKHSCIEDIGTMARLKGFSHEDREFIMDAYSRNVYSPYCSNKYGGSLEYQRKRKLKLTRLLESDD
jgi:hypothetical protein